MKNNWSKFVFLVLYVDDTLLACNDKDFLPENKQVLTANFDMKDLGDASFVRDFLILSVFKEKV